MIRRDNPANTRGKGTTPRGLTLHANPHARSRLRAASGTTSRPSPHGRLPSGGPTRQGASVLSVERRLQCAAVPTSPCSLPGHERRGATQHAAGGSDTRELDLDNSLARQAQKGPRRAVPVEGPKRSRRRPTLPHRLRCSTIGAAELNFRVRNGNGCFLRAGVTGKALTPRRRCPAAAPANRIESFKGSATRREQKPFAATQASKPRVQQPSTLVKPNDRLVRVS